MTEIELWDGTKANPKPVAKLSVSEAGVKVVAGEGKVRVKEIPRCSKFEENPEKRYMVYVTNLDTPIDLITDGVILEEIAREGD